MYNPEKREIPKTYKIPTNYFYPRIKIILMTEIKPQVTRVSICIVYTCMHILPCLCFVPSLLTIITYISSNFTDFVLNFYFKRFENKYSKLYA